MTKDEVKLLCEHNPQLQWWAMVLFAEIVEMIDSSQPKDLAVLTIVSHKSKEFKDLIIQENLNAAKKHFEPPQEETQQPDLHPIQS